MAEFDDDFNFPIFPDLPWLSLEDDFHGTVPVASGHEPTESEPIEPEIEPEPAEHEPIESEPAEHEPGDFEMTIDSSNLIFHMPEAPQVEVEEKDRGGDAMVQTFYEGPPRYKYCTNWVERPPARIPEATQDRYDRVAIRIYKKKGGTKRYGNILGQRIEEIEIQSPVIIKAIQPLLAEVGIPVHSERQGLIISSPFKELYFAHLKILNLVQLHKPGSLKRTHLDLLAKTLNKLFADISREVTDLNAEKRTSFRYLWTLFPKDIIIYSRVHGLDRLYQVITTEEYKEYFQVTGRVIIDPFAFEKFEPGYITELETVEGVQERSEAEKIYFYVDNIVLVSWNEEAYDYLVLPEKTKGLLRIFVGNHRQLRANYPDNVVGSK
ncbi:MAG: hypothetical protein L6R38_001389, partial [Xanthoria sp. 2 TBL-2021]